MGNSRKPDGEAKKDSIFKRVVDRVSRSRRSHSAPSEMVINRTDSEPANQAPAASAPASPASVAAETQTPPASVKSRRASDYASIPFVSVQNNYSNPELLGGSNATSSQYSKFVTPDGFNSESTAAAAASSATAQSTEHPLDPEIAGQANPAITIPQDEADVSAAAAASSSIDHSTYGQIQLPPERGSSSRSLADSDMELDEPSAEPPAWREAKGRSGRVLANTHSASGSQKEDNSAKEDDNDDNYRPPSPR